MKKTRSQNLSTAINIISSVSVLVVNLAISFFLSPYIIRTVGVEANGFVNLANNFIMYANLIVTTLNAMAARFITIAYVQEDYDRARLYYNSVFWGNLIIVAVLFLPVVWFVARLEQFIRIPAEILVDVKILFSLTFVGFFLRTGAPNWDCGTYVKNRMDLSYLPNMVFALLRCGLLILLFSIWNVHIWYLGFVSLVVTVLTLAVAGFNTHRLTPELTVALRRPICSWQAIRELVGAGIWSSIATVGNMCLTGLDLLLCNLYLGPTLMGVLSLSKLLPNILNELSESVRCAFGPELTISYARGDREQIKRCIARAMKITSVLLTIPVAGIIIMGDAFFALWVPTQDAKLLQLLTTLAIMGHLVTSGVAILFGVFSTVNKVKYNSVAMIVSGLCSLVVTLALIRWTDYDLYAVAGVSSVVNIVRNLCFTVPVAARLLHFKWYQFYPQVLQTLVCSGLVLLEGWLIRCVLPVDSWVMFFVTAAVIALLGLWINMMVVLNKEERGILVEKLRKILHI